MFHLLSAAAVVWADSAGYKPRIVDYLRDLSFSFGAVLVLSGYLVRLLPPPTVATPALEALDRRRFLVAGGVLTALALVLLGAALAPAAVQPALSTAALAGLVALLVYAGCPARKALAAATRPTQSASSDAASEASEEQDRLLDATTLESTAALREEGEVGDLRLARSGWAHAEFWLVLVIFFVNFGCGLMVSVRSFWTRQRKMTRRCGQLVNNLGQIVPALGGAPGSQDSAVSLFSVCSCLGRLFTGLLSEQLRNS